MESSARRLDDDESLSRGKRRPAAALVIVFPKANQT
jgi:hypothetical protein